MTSIRKIEQPISFHYILLAIKHTRTAAQL